MKKTLMGNHAAAVGVKLARAEVISAYPITPQTQVVELLAQMEADGELPGRLLRVESEHSAMAALVGAATAGARAFTATSSHGLAYMHEMLHWAAGARLPIVMAEVNRAIGSPWNIWTDQTDSLSQRDTGWLQVYCSTNQEILDSILIAYRVAEELLLPAMVAYDGFVLSHTYEPVEVPSQEAVDRYLPRLRHPCALDPAQPRAYGGLAKPAEFFRLRRRMDADMRRAHKAFARAHEDFEWAFGRRYSAVERYRCDDAEVVLVTSGAPASTALEAVDRLRREGLRAGNLRVRLFRPFPSEELRRAVRPGVKLAVVDRNLSPGHHGIFCEELKSALYAAAERVPVHGFIAGLGGGDITVELLMEIARMTAAGETDERVPAWMEDAR